MLWAFSDCLFLSARCSWRQKRMQREEPEKPATTPSEPIKLGFNLNQMIQRVDHNVTQEIIVTTADKARLCLIEALGRLERRDAWIAPAGILATLAVAFPTT